jgi:hypothetical protein
MALLKRAQDLAVSVENVKAIEADGGTYVLTGAVESVKAAPGTPVKLRFTLFDKAGKALGTQDISLNAPAAGATAPFEVKAATQGEVVGWKYEVVS